MLKKTIEMTGIGGVFVQEKFVWFVLIVVVVLSFVSALHDKRFSKIVTSELSSLKCSISLLHSFTKASAWNDWEVMSIFQYFLCFFWYWIYSCCFFYYFFFCSHILQIFHLFPFSNMK